MLYEHSKIFAKLSSIQIWFLVTHKDNLTLLSPTVQTFQQLGAVDSIDSFVLPRIFPGHTGVSAFVAY